MRRRLTTVALLAGSVLLTLVVAELALRLTRFDHLRLGAYAVFPDGYFVNDSEMGVDHARDVPPQPFAFRGPGHTVFTNAAGCFDEAAPAGPGYILALGDSFAWGYTELDDKWTSGLERTLDRRVAKCGVSGTGSRHQRIKARRVIDSIGAAPALVLLLYTENDFNDDAVFPGYVVVEGRRLNTLRSLDLVTGERRYWTADEVRERYRVHRNRRRGVRTRLQRTFVLNAMLEQALQPAGPPPAPQRTLHSRYGFNLLDADPREYPWVGEAFEAHLETLRGLAADARAAGAELVVFSDIPSRDGLRAPLHAFFADELPHHGDLGAALHEAARGRRITHRFDAHWNPAGNRLVAGAMAAYLRERGLVDGR